MSKTALLGNAFGLGFCVSFAVSFVLMSQIVQQDGPLVSTLLTYGLSQFLILLIRFRHIGDILRASLSNFRLFSWVNLLTCTNTILVYIILTHLTAFTYVILFFGTLPAGVYLMSLRSAGPIKVTLRESFIALVALAVGIASIYYGGNSFVSDPAASLLGVVFTLLASLAGAAYLLVSKRFQKVSGLATIDLVAARFTFTVLASALWLVLSKETFTVSVDKLFTYLMIALLGSLIPLFLLQKSNELAGPEVASRFLPAIPVLCGLFTVILVPELLTRVDALLGLLIFLAMGSRLLGNPKPEKQATAHRG